MTLLVAISQISPPLRGATFYWAPLSQAENDSISFPTPFFWDLTSANWWDDLTFTDPAGVTNSGRWINGNTAYFGTGGTAPFQIELRDSISVDGITLKNDFGITSLTSQNQSRVLTFAAPTSVINLEGSSSPTLEIRTPIFGNNIVVQTNGGGFGTLRLNNYDNFNDRFFANSLTGNITVNSQTTLEAYAFSSGNYATALNALGNAGVVLNDGATFKIFGEGNSSTGLSGRQFTVPATANTSRIDFTGTAGSIRVDGDGGSAFNTSVSTATTGIQWIGQLNLANAGLYSFNSQSDDGSRLFIDGVLVVNNDGGKGGTPMFSAPIRLAAGRHDIRVDYVNNASSGVMALGFSQSFDDGSTWSPLNTSLELKQAEVNTLARSSSALQMGNNVTLAGNAEIILDNASGNFASAELGGLTMHNGKTLTLKSLDQGNPIFGNGEGFGRTLRFGGDSVFGNTGLTGVITIDSDANISFDGNVADGGRNMTLVKTGTGRLSFSQTSASNNLGSGTKIEMREGRLVLIGSTSPGGNNPIGASEIVLNGGGLVLDSKGVTASGAGPVFGNKVSIQQDATIQSVVNAGSVMIGAPGNPIAINSNKTLTLDAIGGGRPAGDPGAMLVVGGGITGDASSRLVLTSSLMNAFSMPVVPPEFTTAPTGPPNGAFDSTRGIIVLRGQNTFAGIVTLANRVGLQLESTAPLNGKSLTLDGNVFNLMSDGNGSAGFENLNFNNAVTMNGSGTLTVGRANSIAPTYFTTASNKTAQISSLNLAPAATALTVTNNNGYGLDVTGNTVLGASTTITVNTASASNLTSGLKLSGVASGAFALTKAGSGVLELTNAGNTFGTGAINVTGGVLAASSDGALGAFSGINLNAANATFRATGNVTTSKTITLTNAATILEVTGSNTLTLNSALSIPTATNNLTKTNTGTLVLTQAQSAWNGNMTVSQGALRISNANALGAATGTTTLANVGAALELAGVNVAGETLVFSPGNNNTSSGINSAGALRAVSGVNTWGGAINFSGESGTDNQYRSALIGVDAGASLTISGIITGRVGLIGGGTQRGA